MGVNVSLLLIDNRQGSLVETGKLLLRKGRVVQAAEKLRGDFVVICGMQGCIHFYDPDPWRSYGSIGAVIMNQGEGETQPAVPWYFGHQEKIGNFAETNCTTPTAH
ncbi:hypothetical protein NYP20_29225 [Pseudomonas sp. N3-W]|uniref:hypothetical protein n=1 Tax=Pseudomonas sp. N3-W TaxID=2975049 RepID=UPI00217DBDB7|nr:hypothetical protein [Pseudomonas sp. N3-W]UWF49320.1 hypothetical protein NYP20_29225 [Pseudomonas sp. N3-W]